MGSLLEPYQVVPLVICTDEVGDTRRLQEFHEVIDIRDLSSLGKYTSISEAEKAAESLNRKELLGSSYDDYVTQNRA